MVSVDFPIIVQFLIARKPESPRLAASSTPVSQLKERIQAVLLPAEIEREKA